MNCEKFGDECPDPEACMTGVPCHVVRDALSLPADAPICRKCRSRLTRVNGHWESPNGGSWCVNESSHEPEVPADRLSAREEWAVKMSAMPRTPAENREMLDFLGYPDVLPHGGELAKAVVVRILRARARGEHIA